LQFHAFPSEAADDEPIEGGAHEGEEGIRQQRA
jgi:hypothetical protein